MEENIEDVMELFTQNGVLLKSAPAAYFTFLNTTGIISITEYLNSNRKRCVEWKPNDIIVDTDTQDQEWDVVNVVERRSRTLSESVPPDSATRSKYLRISFSDIRSFKVNRSGTKLTFFDGKSDALGAFFFQNATCDSLVLMLKNLLRTVPAKRDKHLFIIIDDNIESQRLDRSFAELNLFQEEPYHIWKFLKNFQESPYAASMEAFAKMSDIGNYAWAYYFTILRIGRDFIFVMKVICLQ